MLDVRRNLGHARARALAGGVPDGGAVGQALAVPLGHALQLDLPGMLLLPL